MYAWIIKKKIPVKETVLYGPVSLMLTRLFYTALQDKDM